MLFSGILILSSKLATQYGDGEALISFWKNSQGTYHQAKKVIPIQLHQTNNTVIQNKYRKCAHMKIAAAAGALGEKVKVDTVYNSLVNEQGGHSTQNTFVFTRIL